MSTSFDCRRVGETIWRIEDLENSNKESNVAARDTAAAQRHVSWRRAGGRRAAARELAVTTRQLAVATRQLAVATCQLAACRRHVSGRRRSRQQIWCESLAPLTSFTGNRFVSQKLLSFKLSNTMWGSNRRTPDELFVHFTQHSGAEQIRVLEESSKIVSYLLWTA